MAESATAMITGQESTPPAATPTDGNATPPAADTWYSGFDTETVGWMENRGLTKLDEKAALQEAVKGHRNAEKYMGVPADKLLRLPDFDKADKVELDQFYGKLGRPGTPAEYKLEVPEGQPRDFADWAQNVFHEIGMPARQAAALTAKWNEFVAAQTAGQADAAKAKMAAQADSLRREWGDAYDKLDFQAGEAIGKLGIPGDKLQALAGVLGFDTAMKMFADIGAKIGEDRYVAGSGPANGPMTPEQARSRVLSLRNDKDFTARLLGGNADAKAEWDRLHQMMAA